MFWGLTCEVHNDVFTAVGHKLRDQLAAYLPRVHRTTPSTSNPLIVRTLHLTPSDPRYPRTDFSGTGSDETDLDLGRIQGVRSSIREATGANSPSRPSLMRPDLVSLASENGWRFPNHAQVWGVEALLCAL